MLFALCMSYNLLGTTLTASQSYLKGNIQSNNTSNGTLVVTGGAGITSSVYIGGNVGVLGFTNVNDTSSSGSATFGNIRCISIEESTNVNLGSLSIKGGAGVIGNVYCIELEELQLLEVDTFVSESEAE
jgi:hypothetical protein